MVNATNVSQKASKHSYVTSHTEELKLKQIMSEMKRTSHFNPEDWHFLHKELNLNLRTAYGIYLAMCREERIAKVITWRTFYMQCNGYRVLKENTIKALAKYALICAGTKEAMTANDTITL